MWLQYALDRDDNLVSVSDRPRGRSDIRCPYCKGELTAKKGKIKAHHFAHINQTCNYVKYSTNCGLSLYDRFDLGIKTSVFKDLLEHWDKSNSKKPKNPPHASYLEGFEATQYNEYAANGRGAWEYTKLGLIAVGGLSIDLFNQIQEPKLIEQLEEIESEILELKDLISEYPKASPNLIPVEVQKQKFQDKITDYKICLTQYRRILTSNLYFLEVTADGEVFHKIGVTGRAIEQRIAEIKRDLLTYYQNVSIKGLGYWEHRGNVEYYFKYRYRKFKYPIGSLTEYFKFDDIKPVLRDLRRMKPKQLSAPSEARISRRRDRERQILENKPLDKVLLSLYIRHGMQKALEDRIHIGRLLGETESSEDFLAKPKNQTVIAVLKKGLSLRQTASIAGVSVNTVRKVKAAIERNSPRHSV